MTKTLLPAPKRSNRPVGYGVLGAELLAMARLAREDPDGPWVRMDRCRLATRVLMRAELAWSEDQSDHATDDVVREMCRAGLVETLSISKLLTHFRLR
jgi:hypothetical protein